MLQKLVMPVFLAFEMFKPNFSVNCTLVDRIVYKMAKLIQTWNCILIFVTPLFEKFSLELISHGGTTRHREQKYTVGGFYQCFTSPLSRLSHAALMHVSTLSEITHVISDNPHLILKLFHRKLGNTVELEAQIFPFSKPD